MILSETTIPLTGFPNPSVKDVSVTGLRTFRTGQSRETVTGVLLLISGSVNAVTWSASVHARSLLREAATPTMQM